MQEITTIHRKGKRKPLKINDHLTVEEAITFARDNGFTGRLEIRNSIQEKENVVTYSLYFINEENKITGAVFPFSNF